MKTRNFAFAALAAFCVCVSQAETVVVAAGQTVKPTKDIIGDVLSDFNKIETGYMDIIRDCIEGRADKMIRLEAQREEAR